MPLWISAALRHTMLPVSFRTALAATRNKCKGTSRLECSEVAAHSRVGRAARVTSPSGSTREIWIYVLHKCAKDLQRKVPQTAGGVRL